MRQVVARTAVRGRFGGGGTRLSVVVAALLATLALAACSSSSKSSGSGGTSTQAPKTLKTATGSAGTYLTDGRGFALYDFVNDTPTSSTCVGSCATFWPPVTSPATAGSGVTASLITTITRPDGTKQVAYNGHPLYFYNGDSAAGQTNGQGLNQEGGVWWLLSPAGDEIHKK
ncbi:MAG TPA: hypothetical protein VKB69_08860 [Micromonosporaceae bacterium]|nr:hypothetical protein [Micromonosporaceae bacterium]